MKNIINSIQLFLKNIIKIIDELILMSLRFHHRDIHIRLDELNVELQYHRLIFQAYKELYEIVNKNNADYTKLLEENVNHIQSQLYVSQLLDSIRNKYLLFKVNQIELYQYGSDNNIENDNLKSKFLEESLNKTKEFENEIMELLNSAKK